MRAALVMIVGLVLGCGAFAQQSGQISASPVGSSPPTGEANLDDPFARAFAALDVAEQKSRAKAHEVLMQELTLALGHDGVTAEQLAALAEHRERFLRSVNRRFELIELRRQREAYDRAARELLGEANYAAYRRYEATKNFRDEVSRIATGGLANQWDAAARETLVQLLAKFAVHVESPWMPLAPEVDELETLESAVEAPARQMHALQKSLKALTADPTFQALPNGLQTQVSNYVENRLETLRVQAMTPEERRAWIEARVMRDRMRMHMIDHQIQMHLHRFDPRFQPKLPTYY